jgi:hypothetical protein
MHVEKQKASFVATAAFFYGFLGLICGLQTGDQLYAFYSISLGFYSCLYHYYGELRYFKEDLTCSFFFKLHLFTNYIFWMEWQKILTYLFLSDVLGYVIFYFSVTSWESKYKNSGYTIFHNIWHIYTGGLAFYVAMEEKKVDIGYWDAFYLMIFMTMILRCKKESLRKIRYFSAKKNITISK